jgi:signal transduction histidine kinase
MDDPLLIYSQRPTPRQARGIGSAAAAILGAALLALPFRSTPLLQVHAFIPVVDTVLLLGDVLTATLLFAQASVLRARSLFALATGYLFTGLIIVPHALTFPGAFTPGGLLGAGTHTTSWLYFFWHLGLPLAVVAYAELKERDRSGPMAPARVRAAITAGIAGSVLAAVALTLLATVGEPLLPALMADPIHALQLRIAGLALATVGLLAVAMIAVWRGERSLFDLFLLLALWAWMLEAFLLITTSSRFSVAWYVGRTVGMLSAVFVLVLLLAETTRLHARLALSALRERRERESRMLTMNALAAAMAHEIKQPLTAIVANAAAGSRLVRRRPLDVTELSDIFASIAESGHDAAHVVNSIRPFSKQPGERAPLDVNELVRATVKLIGDELTGWRITLRLDLDETLPPVIADRLQIQHVVLNLMVNAVEAMTAVTDRSHTLAVGSGADQPDEVFISVIDSGIGLDPAAGDRIFEAFFTTKPGGTGMGLALCRSIVQAHEGRLSAAPGTPHGAAFHVRLPVAGTAGPARVGA